jgi:hypothetical protein
MEQTTFAEWNEKLSGRASALHLRLVKEGRTAEKMELEHRWNLYEDERNHVGLAHGIDFTDWLWDRSEVPLQLALTFRGTMASVEDWLNRFESGLDEREAARAMIEAESRWRSEARDLGPRGCLAELESFTQLHLSDKGISSSVELNPRLKLFLEFHRDSIVSELRGRQSTVY